MGSQKVEQRVEVGTKQLGEFITDAYALNLYLRNGELECSASITVYETSDSLPPGELITILQKQGITATVDLEQVAIFCSQAAQGQKLEYFPLAQGQAPTPGEDGWFELIVNTGKEKSDLIEDETGRVDFKSVQSFSNIEPGQMIGVIYPPTPGVAGFTVTGKPIPAKAGHPSRLIAGNGIKISDDGTQVIAERAGRAVLDNHVLSITEEMVVTGDVDLTVGHITFNGFVDIKGDVLDDFHITATKGINVTGTVGACQIQADGPVTLGSMAGKGIGKVTCKGTFRSRYLNQVQIECWGDIHVEHEVRNSILKATGSIQCPKGLLSGGEAVALEGIEVKILGARAGAKTHVTSGVYFPETDRLKFLRTRIKSVIEQIKKIGETLSGLNKKPMSTLRSALREAIELRIGILTQRQVNLDEEREDLSEELLSFQVAEHKTANPKINVLGSLKERVVINLGESSEESIMEVSGPTSIIENTSAGGLRFLTYSPLKVSAEKMLEEEPEAT